MNTNTRRSSKTRIVFVISILLVLISSVFLSACSATKVEVKNSDFGKLGKNGLPEGWTFNSYYASAGKAEVVKDESGASVVKLTNTAQNDTHLFQEVEVKPNTIYRFTVEVKTENVQGGAGANIGLEDISCHSTPVTGTTDWQRIELVGKTGGDQKKLEVGIRLGNYSEASSGIAYFRNFSCEKLNSYSGSVLSFNKAKTSSTSSADADEAQTKARLTTAAFTVIVFAIVPLGIAFFVWYEHLVSKRSRFIRPKSPAQLAPSFFDASNKTLPEKTDTRLRYTKLDWIFVCVLTFVYAVLAVTNLGSLKVPDNEWKGEYGAAAVIEFDHETEIGEIWQHGGITGNYKSWDTADRPMSTTYTVTAENGTVIAEAKQTFDIMYRWDKITPKNKTVKTKSVTLTVTSPGKDRIAWLNEIAFFDTNGNLIPAHAVDPANAALVDEQDCIPEYPNYMDGMYFDELYHARTAYENVHNMKVHETTHPPLGKLIISLGIRIFGMKPFGWRIMGAIFGILMVPLMYAFGKRMFKRPELALLTAALMTFDFMHYAQTRISTIDSYGVFFNLCMTYYMYKFIKMDLGDSLASTLIPLGLSGIFFGIGCASKWICIYTGAALAVMFFAKMIMLWIKANKIRNDKHTDAEKETPAYQNALHYPKRFLKTVLFCIPFFIVIPAMIYIASYHPYYTSQWLPNAVKEATGKEVTADEIAQNPEIADSALSYKDKVKTYIDGVIGNQKSMFEYHSKLTSTHPSESRWYEWPLSNRPMWFYAGYQNPDQTKYGTISSFGNPAVWWVCFAGTVLFVVLWLRGRFKLNAEVFFILCCMASSFIPWVLISRSVYIYHYFATVPMIILASVYALKHYEDVYYYGPMMSEEIDTGKKKKAAEVIKPKKWMPWIKYIWIALVIGLFILFYPVITGLQVKRSFIESLQWLPTWTFMGQWPTIFPR